MVRTLASVFGGPNLRPVTRHRHQLPVHDDLASQHVEPVDRQAEHFPCRMPVPAAKVTTRPELARQRIAQRVDLLSGRRHDLTRSRLGSLVPSHGFATMRRSRTAAFIIVATMLCTTPIVDGASARRPGSSTERRFTQA